MQITEIVLARTAWFFNVRLLNPAGLSWGPILSSFKDRYKFLVYPSAPSEFDFTKGIRYDGGEFTFEGKQINVGVSIYSDGWYVDTMVSTEASDTFLDDLVGWVSTSFGLRHARDIVTRVLYDSQIVFTSDINLTKSSDELQAFNNLLCEFSGNPTEELSAIVFGSNPASPNPTTPTFTFERRVNVPFTENKYYSRAALPTKKHIQLLEHFQRMFS